MGSQFLAGSSPAVFPSQAKQISNMYVLYACIIFYVFIAGDADIECGPHPITFSMSSMIERVNISTIDDNDTECDEEFTAKLAGDGNSSLPEGYRRGPTSNVNITVEDDEGDVYEAIY